MSDDVLELLARAPEPVMHLDPSRVISAGKRTRRRRRTLSLVAGVVIACCLSGAAAVAGWAPPAHNLTPAGPARATAPVTSSATPAPIPSTGGDAAARTWGPVHVMSDQRNREGRRPALYLTPDRSLCIGTVDAAGNVMPSVCRHIKAPPSDSFGAGYAWSMEGDLPPGADANEFIAGVVAQDVTKVVVRTESGDLDAHLARAPDPKLGQLYWIETQVPVLTSHKHAEDRSRIAYRGTKVAFTCGYFECVRE